MATDGPNKTRKSFGPQCFVINCYNYKNSKPEGVTFHKFPRSDKSPERHRLWIRGCRRTDPSPTNYSLVCSVHFSEEQIDRTGQIVRLRSGVVPNLVTLPLHLQKEPTSVRYTATSQSELEPLPVAFDNPQHSVIEEHSYTSSDSPGKLKRVLQDKEEQLSAARKKLRNAEKREAYAKDKSSQYLEQLEELNHVNAKLRLQLEAFGGIFQWQLSSS